MASNGEKLHIIVTCTDRKTARVPPQLRLRDVPGGELRKRARGWVERLATEVAIPTVPATDLYAGEHWTRARALPVLATAAQAQLWACSAGYGLIPTGALVRPYAATLSPGHADSVPGGRTGAATWWEAIASWQGPAPGQPRTFCELVKSDSSAAFLLVLSATYLQACEADIEAAGAVADPDRFMIVSAGTRAVHSLGQWLLPASARLQAHVGGTRQVLNVRIAEELLKGQFTNRTAATEHLEDLSHRYPHIERYDRQKFSGDADVIEWIRTEYSVGRGASASRMLRALRDSGRACEQHRFSRLHRQFRDELERTGSQP